MIRGVLLVERNGLLMSMGQRHISPLLMMNMNKSATIDYSASSGVCASRAFSQKYVFDQQQSEKCLSFVHRFCHKVGELTWCCNIFVLLTNEVGLGSENSANKRASTNLSIHQRCAMHDVNRRKMNIDSIRWK